MNQNKRKFPSHHNQQQVDAVGPIWMTVSSFICCGSIVSSDGYPSKCSFKVYNIIEQCLCIASGGMTMNQ